MDDLRQRVLDFIQSEGLVDSGGTLLVAVSGGPDSVCLLHILDSLKGALKTSLHVAHLNHMLRGGDSDADACYVTELARSLGIPATVEQCDVAAYREERRMSLEEAAREARYDFLARTAASIGADRVALGHTRDDQVETILMHMVRGAGLAGLRGMLSLARMPSIHGGDLLVIRPLLETSRAETEDYCRSHTLNPRHDASNYSLEHTRNRFRHEVLPALRKVNRRVDEALLRTARAAGDDLSFIEGEVASLWGELVTEQPNGLLLDGARISSLHPALQRHLLRKAVERVLGDLVDVQAVHIERMMAALAGSAGRRISLPRGVSLHIGYGTSLLAQGAGPECPFPPLDGERRLNVPGETSFSGWRVTAEVVSPDTRADGFEACLDLDAVGADLVVRPRRAGDRFKPLGMAGAKRLQDFMVDAKVPRAWRDSVPLVCSPDGIVWVVGWRIAEGARVTGATARVLKLAFERI